FLRIGRDGFGPCFRTMQGPAAVQRAPWTVSPCQGSVNRVSWRLLSNLLTCRQSETDCGASSPRGKFLKLIERYIFRRTLNLTLASLGLVTFIVLTTQSLLYLNIVTQSGQSLATFLKLALTLIPTMLLVVMPFALLLGATSTLNRL